MPPSLPAVHAVHRVLCVNYLLPNDMIPNRRAFLVTDKPRQRTTLSPAMNALLGLLLVSERCESSAFSSLRGRMQPGWTLGQGVTRNGLSAPTSDTLYCTLPRTAHLQGGVKNHQQV
jgi:hypothetical protein